VGESSLLNNTAGSSNSSLGQGSLVANTTGNNNTAVGESAINDNSTGSKNSALGSTTFSGNFTGSVILGYLATATANNQFVVGSAGTNAGAITTEVLIPTASWTVRINGVNYKIPLQIA